MLDAVTVPLSYFDLEAVFERPRFNLWSDRAGVVQAIFDALERWAPRIEDVEAVSTGKLSEEGIRIKLPLQRTAFFLGPASYRFTRDVASLQAADETGPILDAAVAALIRSSDVKVALQKALVGLHVQPRSRHFADILSRFIPPQLAALEAEPATTMAVVTKWANRTVTIDGSNAIANGIFVKLERDFPGDLPYSDLARQFRSDKGELLGVLGLVEAQG